VFINDILQPTHLLFILVVALLVLGPKRLPEAGRALGNGIRSFRSAIGGEEDRSSAIPTAAAPSPPPETMVPPAPAPPAEATMESGAIPADGSNPAHAASPAEPATEVTAETAEQHAEPVHPVG
jgi:sec-independent protein translocase protein TatA